MNFKFQKLTDYNFNLFLLVLNFPLTRMEEIIRKFKLTNAAYYHHKKQPYVWERPTVPEPGKTQIKTG